MAVDDRGECERDRRWTIHIEMPPVEAVGDGFRWGKKGHVYRGKNARKKAAAQGYAAMKNGYREPGVDEKEVAAKLYGG